MTKAERINEDLIKEAKTAINNTKNAYDGAFEVKEETQGNDVVFLLTSKEWKKDSRIKISVTKLVQPPREADNYWYWANCNIGILLDKKGYIGFVSEKTALDKDLTDYVPNRVKDFLENIFLPISIEILKYYKKHASNIKNFNTQKLRDFYYEVFIGTIEKVPTEKEIADIFKAQTSESKEEKEQTNESSKEEYEAYIKRFEEERQAAIDASHKFTLLLADKKFDEAYEFIHSNEFKKAISWFGDYRKQIEHFEDEWFASKNIAMGKNPDGIEWKKK